MRFLSGLAMLLLMVPSACSLPSQPVVIHVTGQHVDAGLMLEWEVLGGPLTALELVRIDAAGDVDVLAVDPDLRVYVDSHASASMNHTYILYAEFDGGVTASNAYHALCPYVVYDHETSSVKVRPECLDAALASKVS